MSSGSHTCPVCGQRNSAGNSGSFTQWLTKCRCDAFQDDSPSSTCTTCGKVVSAGHTGSFTQWVFKSQLCSCARNPGERSGASSPSSDLTEIDAKSFPTERYDPIRKLGTGGVGSVYLCHDKHLNKTVAVKVLHEITANQIREFLSEARLTAKIKHPNVVSILDCGSKNGFPYIVLEYINGVSLREMIRQHGCLPERVANGLFIQIAAGLASGHRIGIFHRDIKSSNVIVSTTAGAEMKAHIIDFGIAVMSGFAAETPTQASNALIGTPQYMSGDQLLGAEFDARSEIYSFGCLMYEVLCGQLPFSSTDPFTLLQKHAFAVVPPFSASAENINIAPEFESIVMRCLQKSPEDRFQTIDEVESVLRKLVAAEVLSLDRNTELSITNSNLNLQRVYDDSSGEIRDFDKSEPHQASGSKWAYPVGIAICLSAVLFIVCGKILLSGKDEQRSDRQNRTSTVASLESAHTPAEPPGKPEEGDPPPVSEKMTRLEPLSENQQAIAAYDLILHRKPSTTELAEALPHVSKMAPTAVQDYCRRLARREEFLSKLEKPAGDFEKIKLLYQELLGREPESEDACKHWFPLLKNPANLIDTFFNSQELRMRIYSRTNFSTQEDMEKVRKIMIFLENGHKTDARDALKELSQETVLMPEGFVLAASLAKSDVQKRKWLDYGLKFWREDPWMHMERARIMLALGRPKDALADLDVTQKYFVDHPTSQHLRAEISSKMEQ